jgi:hypothetical protein
MPLPRINCRLCGRNVATKTRVTATAGINQVREYPRLHKCPDGKHCGYEPCAECKARRLTSAPHSSRLTPASD